MTSSGASWAVVRICGVLVPFNFVLWPFGIADEVEESVFLAVEFGELFAQEARSLVVVCFESFAADRARFSSVAQCR